MDFSGVYNELLKYWERKSSSKYVRSSVPIDDAVVVLMNDFYRYGDAGQYDSALSVLQQVFDKIGLRKDSSVRNVTASDLRSYFYDLYTNAGTVAGSTSPSEGGSSDQEFLDHADITANALAQNQVVANVASSGADWQNVLLQVSAGTGLAGGGTMAYSSGALKVTLSVAFAGTGSASTVAHSDHTHALDDLSDVVVSSSPAAGNVLTWTSGAWRDAAVPAPEHLSDIGDVDTSGIATDSILKWDGSSKWIIGSTGNSHSFLAHTDVDAQTVAVSQVPVIYEGTYYHWRNVVVAVEPGTGLSGGGDLAYEAGPPERLKTTLSVSFGGNGSANTVSRSDHTHALNDLSDVDAGSPGDGQILEYSTTSGGWVVGDKSPNYYVDGINWVAPTLTLTRVGLASLTKDLTHGFVSDTHSDLTITGLADKDMLQYDSGSGIWKNVPTPPEYAAGDAILIDTSVDPHTISVDYDGVTIKNYTGHGLYVDSSELGPVDMALGELNDVDVSGVSDGQVLVYNNATSQWEPGWRTTDTNYYLSSVDTSNLDSVTFGMTGTSDITGVSFKHSLGDTDAHSDVIVSSSPTEGYVLTWTSGAWRDAAVPAPEHLSSIGDVDTTGVVADDILKWNGSDKWVVTDIGGSHAILDHDDFSGAGSVQVDQFLVVDDTSSQPVFGNYFLQITAGAGLSGGGHFAYDSGSGDIKQTLSVAFAGTGSATTVARSDHTHSYALDDLSDVDASGASDGQILEYSTTAGGWVVGNKTVDTNYYVDNMTWASPRLTLSRSGLASIYADLNHSLTDDIHTDVTITSLATDDILKWDGSSWVNVPIPEENSYSPGDGISISTSNVISVHHDSTLSVVGGIIGVTSGLYAEISDITYETLDSNGDVGSGSGQLAPGNHTHSIYSQISGTPADNYVAVWNSSSAIEGTSSLTFDGTYLKVGGSTVVTEGYRDLKKTFQSLTWNNGGTTTWDVDNGYNAEISVGTSGTTLSLSNLEDGDIGTLVISCSSSSQNITLSGKSIDDSGTTFPTTADSSAVDILTFVYKGTTLYWTYGKNYK